MTHRSGIERTEAQAEPQPAQPGPGPATSEGSGCRPKGHDSGIPTRNFSHAHSQIVRRSVVRSYRSLVRSAAVHPCMMLIHALSRHSSPVYALLSPPHNNGRGDFLHRLCHPVLLLQKTAPVRARGRIVPRLSPLCLGLALPSTPQRQIAKLVQSWSVLRW